MKVIDDQLIDSIEHVFLPQGASFADERRDFIKKISSCDLLAVPGSGKTTALLAKLACVVMANADNDGILVLSHTNTAVDEIKDKLEGKFGVLFNYPNCVCTVQEFVDTFLAIPFYENINHSSVDYIDKDRYEEELEYELARIRDKRIGYLKNKNYDFKKIRFGIKDGNRTVGEDISCDELKYEIPRTWAGHEDENKAFVVSKLLEVKNRILQKGVLHYDDCYFLAESYISDHPEVISFLRKRFKYIFVDEAQDLAKHQIEVLDKLFNSDECVLQRVGDNNQSIYHKVSEDTVWMPRNVLYIRNSQRFTPEIADVVNAFTLNKGADDRGNVLFNVAGKRTLANPIPPYLLLYEEGTMGNLENIFRDIINHHSLTETIEAQKYGFHIIGWNGNKEEAYNINKLRLEDIFPRLVVSKSAGKVILTTLSDYIQLGRKGNTLHECRNSVLSAMSTALRLSRTKDVNNRYYTPSSLYKYAIQNDQYKELFEMIIYDVAVLLVTRQYEEGYNVLKDFVQNHLAAIIPFQENQALRDFLGVGFSHIDIGEQTVAQNPVGLPIEISTVHHVKGMTHCATMYVETFYYEYECNHLIKETKGRLGSSPFFKDTCCITGKRAKQAMKMLYVGMSRPTHLLCYASLKQNWNDARLQKMRDAGWQVIEVT